MSSVNFTFDPGQTVTRSSTSDSVVVMQCAVNTSGRRAYLVQAASGAVGWAAENVLVSWEAGDGIDQLLTAPITA